MDVNELLRQYAEGKRDFGFVDLQGARLSGRYLAGIALYQANLRGAILTQADLSSANLRQADLQGANLSQANLRGANLRRANLKAAVLEGAILEGAILTGARLPDGSLYQLRPPEEEFFEEICPEEATPEESPSSSNDPQINQAPNPDSPTVLSGSDAAMPLLNRLSAIRPGQAPVVWAPLLFEWLGFGTFGLLLALNQASGFNWLIAWLSSLCWLGGDALTWFIPIIAAIAVFNAAGISVVTLATAGLIALTLLLTLRVMLGWSAWKALRDSLWVGGMVFVLVQLVGWLFYGADAYSGGGIVVAFSTLHLAGLLVLAVGLTSLGAPAWEPMIAQGFSRQRAAAIVSLVSAAGLLCGKVISLF
ncbi:hypothetical protein C7271_18170 [filamentous cyanobacterium CCP5]|nr:hypothetical protein C7271_18170 [filamentous cyanobacterium CCP5]